MPYEPPVAIVTDGVNTFPALVGLCDGELAGFDSVRALPLALSAENILGFVHASPAAIYYGVEAEAVTQALRLVANPARKDFFRRFYNKPLGENFQALPAGVLSGYPIARPTILRLREQVPTAESLTLSMIFAGFSVRTEIAVTEAGYDCFGKKFLASRMFPRWKDLRECSKILGLPSYRKRLYEEAIPYGHVVHDYMQAGLRDRELRRVLVRETKLPRGLSLAKLSFSLALCGQDLICLDARLLNAMFGKNVEKAERGLGKKLESGFVSDLALERYERIEDAFLRGNRYYDSKDPVGRARAQWLAWEASPVRGEPVGAAHETWLRLIR